MNPVLQKNFIAEAAIAAYRILKLGAADGQVLQAAAATDAMIGVANEVGAAINERQDVIVAGIADVELGGVVARGDGVTADATGKGVAATRHTHTENTAAAYTQNATTAAASGQRKIGIALASGVAGDIIPVLLAPGYA